MLTQQQIQSLEKYKSHQKFGRLISKAIEEWCACDQSKFSYGLSYKENNDKWCDEDYNHPKCLIGAAINQCSGNIKLINEEYDPQEIKASEEYNIPVESVHDLLKGFETMIEEWAKPIDQEAYQIGKEISKIIFG